MNHSCSPFPASVKPVSNCGHMAHPGRVSRPVVPFQRLKVLKLSLKVSVAVAERLFGSIATLHLPRWPWPIKRGFSGVLTDPLELDVFFEMVPQLDALR